MNFFFERTNCLNQFAPPPPQKKVQWTMKFEIKYFFFFKIINGQLKYTKKREN